MVVFMFHGFLVIVIAGLSLDVVVGCTQIGTLEQQTTGPVMTMMTKWLAGVRLFDADGNGVIYGHEIHSAVMKLISHYHVSGDGLDGLMQMEHLFNDMTQAYFGVDGSEKGMTQTEVAMGLALYWYSHFERFKFRFTTYYTAVFHSMDSNNDDAVTFEEFEYFYERFGSSDEIKNQAKKTFKIIDTNGDGSISEEEYRDTYVKYFTDSSITYDELPLF